MILAIDQGTTGTRCLVVDDELRVRGRAYAELRQSFPQPGWVEHDPVEIRDAVLATAAAALADARARPSELTAVGITNQRETTVVWERAGGRPVHPAIVWQDRRTAERCRGLPAALVRERTGLVPDPYFSASKLEWILARVGTPQRELCFGTVDSWLAWSLTGGRAHVTDVTNASRTMLLDLERGAWDDDLLDLFGVDRSLLPDVRPSSAVVAEADLLGATVPIAGIAGDQQAALVGHGCAARGEAKATYGTGCFVLVVAGPTPGPVVDGVLRTAAAAAPGVPSQFAWEGAALVAGAAVQWLRDGLGLIASAAETEEVARSVESTDGVVFVPALTGLGSPYWDADARGLVTGITRGTTRAHLVRAALEAIAHQVADIVEALPTRVGVLRAGGGASANGLLMQLQADLLGCPVEVAPDPEVTGLGAAVLAGLATGTWRDTAQVASLLPRGRRFEPSLAAADVAERREQWRLAVGRARLRPDELRPGARTPPTAPP